LNLLFFALVSLSAFAQITQWDVVAVSPECRAGIFCTREEVGPQMRQAGVSERLVGMARRAHQSGGRLSLAFMSFNEPSLFKEICRLAIQGLQIDGYFDSKAGPPRGLGHRLQSECQGPGGKNVRMFYMGMANPNRGSWRLHHNKFYLTESPGSPVELAFGSANLSNTGLSVNFENWNFISAQARDPFVADHLCSLRAMRLARESGQSQDDPRVYRRELDGCLSEREISVAQVDRLMREQGAWVLFAPDRGDRIFKILRDQIDRVVAGGRIRMASYLFLHQPLAEALQRAQARGVRVQLLLDDDIVQGTASAPGQKRFYERFLKSSASGFEVRVFDTNEDIFQLQHNKFLLLEGVDQLNRVRLFTGAGQFTRAAFEENYENFYLIETPQVVRQYSELFDLLWIR